MATIQTLKTDNDILIRQQVAVDSIDTDDVADRYDAIADELLVRGVANAPSTGSMSTFSGANYRLCIVKDNGIFEWLGAGTVDGINIFAASGGGVWSRISTDSGAPSVVALDDLSDVILNVPTVGDRLEYNGSEWVNVPKLLEPAGNADFAFVVPNDVMMAVIMIELTANIAAFKIGTSPGADDIVVTQPLLLAGNYHTFPVFFFTGPGVTLEFGGITSQIYSKIYLL